MARTQLAAAACSGAPAECTELYHNTENTHHIVVHHRQCHTENRASLQRKCMQVQSVHEEHQISNVTFTDKSSNGFVYIFLFYSLNSFVSLQYISARQSINSIIFHIEHLLVLFPFHAWCMVVGLGVSKASTATFCAMQDGKWKNGKTEDVDSRSFFVRRRNENAYTTRKKNENFPVDFIRSLKPLDKRLQSAQTNIECRGVHFGSSNWMSMVAFNGLFERWKLSAPLRQLR